MVVIADTKSACVMTQEEWYLMESKETTIGKHKK